MERKIGGKEIYQAIWLGEFVERKLIGFGYFLHEPTIMFSSQIVEKTKEENQEKEMDQKMCNMCFLVEYFFYYFFYYTIYFCFLFLFLVFLFKRKDEKKWEKMFFGVFDLMDFKKRKLVGFRSFFFGPTKMNFPNLEKKLKRKEASGGKVYFYKVTAQYPATFVLSFSNAFLPFVLIRY